MFIRLRVKPASPQRGASAPKLDIFLRVKGKTKAVDRNKIKRQIRAIMRGFLKHLEPRAYYVIVERVLEKHSFLEFKSELSRVFAPYLI